MSGGSPIPEAYQEISLLRYDPIFFFTTSSINIPTRSENIDLKLIGEGAFALVYKFSDPYYKKVFAKKTLKSNTSDREKERFITEYKVMKEMKFPYILEVYTLGDDSNSYLMEYCESNLQDYISSNNTILSFEGRKRIALQFLYAINYIHSKEYLHQDISFRNILVQKYDKGAIIIKLSDFGLVKDLQSVFTKSDTEYKGSIIDPTIDPSLDKFKDYNVSNEMYAIGIVLQFIFTGKKSIATNKVPIILKSIIEKCTSTNLISRYKNVPELIFDLQNVLSS